MSLEQTLFLKMGNKLIFKEPLKAIKYAIEQNNNMNEKYNVYKPNYNQQSNYNNQNQYSNNSNNNKRKMNYQNMDIIPKFIEDENINEKYKELANKLNDKKGKLNLFINSYFSEGDDNFMDSIQEVEMEMTRYKAITEENKNKDFEGFKNLVGFINENRTNSNLKDLQNINLNDYQNMNFEMKKTVLSGIFENRETFSKKLNLNAHQVQTHTRSNSNLNMRNNYNINNNYNIYNNNIYSNNNYNNEKNYNHYNSNNYNNMNNYNNNNNNNYNINNLQKRTAITKDQIDLFKIFVGNTNIPDNHAISYFDKQNPKVKDAAEKYFKNVYNEDYFTFQFIYKNRGTKIHKFRFSDEVEKLFLAAQDDYASVMKPRLYLDNKKEIVRDKKIKCLGALNIANNSSITVWY